MTGDSALQQWDDVSVKSGKSGKEKPEPQVSHALPSPDDPTIQVTGGSRPNLKQLIQEEVDLTDGRIAVTVCGSQSVSTAVKDALGFPIAGPSSIMKGGPSITLHVESFGYA